MGKLWRDYGVSIILVGLFLASWIGHGTFRWFEMANAALAHGETSTLTEFLSAFFSTTLDTLPREIFVLLGDDAAVATGACGQKHLGVASCRSLSGGKKFLCK